MTDNDQSTIPTGSARSSTLKEFLIRLATDDSDLIEAWVRVAVVDEEYLPTGGSSYEFADPVRGRRGGAVRASLTLDGIDRLERQHGTSLPWRLFIGSELDLKLRTTRHARQAATTEIVDVETAWIEMSSDMIQHYHSRIMAGQGSYDRQRLLEQPTVIRTIDIVRPEDEPMPASITARLSEFETAGVTCRDVPLAMRGTPGFLGFRSHFEQLATGHLPTADMLVVLSESDADLHIRENPDLADLLSLIPCPVLIGFCRGRYGSLLHDVAYSASETPQAALDTAWRIVANARASEAATRRANAHLAREDARRKRGR